MPRLLAPIAAMLLVVTACGDSGATGSTLATLDSGSSETLASPAVTAPATQGPEAPLPESDYPDVVVTDLADTSEVNLKELALEQNPVLLWFWAPH